MNPLRWFTALFSPPDTGGGAAAPASGAEPGAGADPTAEAPWTALEEIDAETRRLWHLLIVTCLGLFAWAAVSPLDVISLAEGTVETSSGVQKVQHLEGGIVREIRVKEGDRVKAGEVLVLMESTQSTSDFGEVDARLTAVQADIHRLEAEAAGQTRLVFPPEFARAHPELVARAIDLFRARRGNLQSNLDAQRNEIAQRQQDLAEISARLANTRSRHQLAVEQVGIGEKLIASELSNRYEQIDRMKEANSLKSRIEEDQQALLRAGEGVEKARSTLAVINSRYDEEVRKELSDARRLLNEQSNRGVKFKDAMRRTELRAPMAGVIKTRHVGNVGAVVGPGGTVVELVPDDSRVIVEARLAPQDIGHVRVGQKAFVQLASAEASRFGRIEGAVTYLSPDSVTDREARTTHYVVHIETDKNHFADGADRYQLSSGVQVSAAIVTGSRSVLEYLLYPILRTMPLALSER